MTTTQAATLDLYPTTHTTENHKHYNFTDHHHTPWTWLLAFARLNDLTLRHDIDSDHTVEGWFVETEDGTTIFHAAITS